MDDTIEDESGIPFLKNGDEIPVHSTPIKGEKVPLPSTRHVSRFIKHRSHRVGDDTTSESIQSVCPSSVMEQSDQRNLHGIGARKNVEILKHSINRHEIPKLPIPQPDRVLDISNQDNLRPKHYSDHYKLDTAKTSQTQKNSNYQNVDQSRQISSYSHDTKQLRRDDKFKFSQSNSGSMNDQSKSRLQTSPPDDNNNAYSSYRNSKKDSKLTLSNSDGMSYSVQISSYKTSNGSPFKDHTDGSPVRDYTIGSPLRDQKELKNERQSVKVESVSKSTAGNPEDSFTERKRFTFNSPKYGSKSNSKQNCSFAELENATIAKQRQEVQLLVSELKDRDRELSDMMSSHQQQLIAWEQDRQRVTSLERKSHQLEDELHNKSSQLRNAVATLKAVKERESDNKTELEKIRSIIDDLRTEKLQINEELGKYKIENGELQNRLETLSSRLGHLQAREAELTTNIKTKEKDIAYATNQMKELSNRLQQLDLRCKECQDREKEAVKERDEWKNKYEQCLPDLKKLKEELEMKRNQCSRLMDENRSARNQLALVQKETDESERCKDDIIESMRVKQERTDTQLKNMRELYDRQLKELSALQMQLDSSKLYDRQLKELSALQMQLDSSKEIIHKQQNSMEQLQYSQSDRSSEITPERNRAKQRLTFSPQNRLSHQHRHREPDYSSHTQSSGYQSQLSDNQTGITAGNQGISTGSVSDLKLEPAVQNTVINSNKMQTNTPKLQNQSNLQQNSASGPETVLSPRNVHEEYLWHKSVEANKIENQSTSFEQDRDNANRNRYGTSTVRGKDRTNTPSPHRQTHRQTNNESPASKLVIKQTTIAMYPNDTSCDNQTSQTDYVSKPHNLPNAQTNNRVPGDSNSAQITNENRGLNPGFNGNGPDFAQAQGVEKELVEGIEKEFVFENKLRSFLEDIDVDIDDSIWEDKPDRTQSISTVDCSPSSKLQKLLLESRMMLENLEKSADIPIQNISFTANDTLEKPNFDNTATETENTASGKDRMNAC